MTLESPVRPRVPAIERAFRVLERLSESEQGLGVSEISRDLVLAKSTAFNILLTLEQLGYVYRDRGGMFRLTYRLFGLGSAVVGRSDVSSLVGPLLDELVGQTGETANLGIRQGDAALYLASVRGPGPVTVVETPGAQIRLHSTALGKVLCAWLPTEDVRSLLYRSGMPKFTPRTCDSIDRFLEELDRVKVLGYAIDDEESAPGMRCIGAPIFDQSGKVEAAVSITAPLQRLSIDDIPRRAAVVVDMAHRMSERLGYVGSGEAPVDRSAAYGA